MIAWEPIENKKKLVPVDKLGLDIDVSWPAARNEVAIFSVVGIRYEIVKHVLRLWKYIDPAASEPSLQ